MACTAINDILARESSRISKDIYDRVFPTSPWIGLIKRGTFPKEMGQTISVLTYERSAPTTAEPTWSLVDTTTDGTAGGACLPAATVIPIASTLRTFSLYRLNLQGPDFCAENLRTPFEVSQQLGAIVSVLAEYSRIEWEIRDRHEYFKFCKRKVVITSIGLVEDATMAAAYPAGTPGSILTQGVLNRYKAKLIRDGAGQSALGKQDGVPVLTLICSGETSDNLIFLNADIRQDLRWGKPNELLASYGVDRSYRGFFHLIDPFPRRFNIILGVLTEVPAFYATAATKGNKTEVNPDYEAATIEESFIFDPTVFEQLIPEPVVAPGANLRFDPANYMGDWKWLNIPDRDCNPRGQIGFHDGILAAGSKPVHPERGVAFLHLRCDPALNLVTSCSA